MNMRHKRPREAQPPMWGYTPTKPQGRHLRLPVRKAGLLWPIAQMPATSKGGDADA